MVDAEELKIEVIYLGTGTTHRPGGQHAGSPPTAIRVTHIPTGLMAQCGELYRSQHMQKQIAAEMIEWGLLAAGWEPSETREDHPAPDGSGLKCTKEDGR